MDDSSVPRNLSIVIPAFQVAAYLEEAVHSAVACAEVAAVIIVTDASPSDALEAHRLESSSTKITVVELRENSGVSAVRNAGLLKVETEWVLFLDGDDVLEGASLGDAIRAASEHDVMIAGSWSRIDVSGSPAPDDELLTYRSDHIVGRHGRATPSALTIESAVTRNTLGRPGNLVFRTATLRSVGGWEERLRTAATSELIVRMMRTGGSIREVDTPLYRYRIRPGQVTSQNQGRRALGLFQQGLIMLEQCGADEIAMMRRALIAHYLLSARTVLSTSRGAASVASAGFWSLFGVALGVAGLLEPARRRFGVRWLRRPIVFPVALAEP